MSRPEVLRRRARLVLPLRTGLFAAFQGLVYLGLARAGVPEAGLRSAGWWPVCAGLAGLVNLAVLRVLLRREGLGLGALFFPAGGRPLRDLLTALGLLTLLAPFAWLPNVGLATLLMGGAEAPLAIFIQPLPVGAAAASLVLFPATIVLTELATYFAYAMPRLEPGRRPGLGALLTAAAWLSAQHAALPLVLEPAFFTWRLLMFLPFAVGVGAVLRWRPRLLPWLALMHGLLDLQVGWMVLRASLG